MATYLITYDLHDKTKETDLLRYVKSMGTMVTASSYAVTTGKTTQQIVDDIKRIAGDNGLNVYVFLIGTTYSGWGASTTNDWLSANVR